MFYAGLQPQKDPRWPGNEGWPMSADIEIYTWSTCPYCNRAKALLRQKGAEFREYVLDGDETGRAAMSQRANGQRSVPQIFINGRHIGGSDDLYQLDSKGQLDSLLK